ncbi:hypothetical protein Nepgr_017954 [Nepenthes gracilis]|uniref:C2H2-type domain-containing protein n=1 Tax=Nepenthes gracilis TaxID=150966 RepID=A0AAD3SQE2_NEPGR|nr:hypothetical protein Nepgr_017954 [Nepenthes gracilis]
MCGFHESRSIIPNPMSTHNISNANNSSSSPVASFSEPLTSKRKRRPAGTPDPDAEVVSLSPRALLESDRYVCEICNQGFQRDQNLQMHRRRHKVPWKLLKRENPAARKRVFVCPEPTCLHHDPCHALGDLVGIKKHFRRKHSNHRQWVCDRCTKAYAVQSDYKAHLKTCGTRGHSCDCGRVFSRAESFIEHQDSCHMGRLPTEQFPALQPALCLSTMASSSSPSSDSNFNPHPLNTTTTAGRVITKTKDVTHSYNLELQLSIGSLALSDKNESRVNKAKGGRPGAEEEGREQLLGLAMAEKAYAEAARREAKVQIELAEREFASANKIRRQAQAELDKVHALKDQAIKKISSTLLQITCHACKQHCQARRASADHDDRDD